MKNFIIFCCGIVGLLLASCSGSDSYRGGWKAMDVRGDKYEIVFDARKLTIRDSDGKVAAFDYTQNSVQVKNSVTTYGIRLSDGRAYQINFPSSSDESAALIKDANGAWVYTIGRNRYVLYEDLYKLQ